MEDIEKVRTYKALIEAMKSKSNAEGSTVIDSVRTTDSDTVKEVQRLKEQMQLLEVQKEELSKALEKAKADFLDESFKSTEFDSKLKDLHKQLQKTQKEFRNKDQELEASKLDLQNQLTKLRKEHGAVTLSLGEARADLERQRTAHQATCKALNATIKDQSFMIQEFQRERMRLCQALHDTVLLNPALECYLKVPYVEAARLTKAETSEAALIFLQSLKNIYMAIPLSPELHQLRVQCQSLAYLFLTESAWEALPVNMNLPQDNLIFDYNQALCLYGTTLHDDDLLKTLLTYFAYLPLSYAHRIQDQIITADDVMHVTHAVFLPLKAKGLIALRSGSLNFNVKTAQDIDFKVLSVKDKDLETSFTALIQTLRDLPEPFGSAVKETLEVSPFHHFCKFTLGTISCDFTVVDKLSFDHILNIATSAALPTGQGIR